MGNGKRKGNRHVQAARDNIDNARSYGLRVFGGPGQRPWQLPGYLPQTMPFALAPPPPPWRVQDTQYDGDRTGSVPTGAPRSHTKSCSNPACGATAPEKWAFCGVCSSKLIPIKDRPNPPIPPGNLTGKGTRRRKGKGTGSKKAGGKGAGAEVDAVEVVAGPEAQRRGDMEVQDEMPVSIDQMLHSRAILLKAGFSTESNAIQELDTKIGGAKEAEAAKAAAIPDEAEEVPLATRASRLASKLRRQQKQFKAAEDKVQELEAQYVELRDKIDDAKQRSEEIQNAIIETEAKIEKLGPDISFRDPIQEFLKGLPQSVKDDPARQPSIQRMLQLKRSLERDSLKRTREHGADDEHYDSQSEITAMEFTGEFQDVHDAGGDNVLNAGVSASSSNKGGKGQGFGPAKQSGVRASPYILQEQLDIQTSIYFREFFTKHLHDVAFKYSSPEFVSSGGSAPVPRNLKHEEIEDIAKQFTEYVQNRRSDQHEGSRPSDSS